MTENKTTNIDIKQMKKDLAEKQKLEKAAASSSNYTPKSVTMGILLALVFGSIVYSTIVVFYGTDDPVSKIMLIPQAGFALFLIIYKFVK